MNKFLKLLLGSGLCLLEESDRTKNVRGRTADKIDDLSDVVQQKYEAVADRVTRASRAIRGEGNPAFGNAARLAAGIGVGIGLGLLFAPASGQDTRRAIAGSVQQFGDKVRKRVSFKGARAANAG